MNRALQAELADFFECRHVIPVGSGTAGLSWLLESIGVRDRRVLVPALVCPNVALAVLAAGGTPSVVDLDEGTYDLSLESVARSMDDSVAAVIAVDAFGYPSDIEALEALAEPFGCPVIEDACQGYGGSVAGRPLGSRGFAGVVSFGHAKAIELRGGGLVLTDDESTYRAIVDRGATRGSWLGSARQNRQARQFMLDSDYDALLASARADGLLRYRFPPHLLHKLKSRWRRWVSELDEVRSKLRRAVEIVLTLPGVEPFRYEGDDWLPWRYSFKAADGAAAADLTARLESVGVTTSGLYDPLADHVPVEARVPLPGAESLAGRVLNLSYRTNLAKTSQMVERLEHLAAGARS